MNVPTVDETQRAIDEIVAKMQPNEVAALQELLSEIDLTGKSKIADTCAELEWEEVPIPIEEWLDSYHHVGDLKDSIYPVLKQDLIDLFTGDYHEVILTGCVDKQALVQCSDGSMPTLGSLIGRRTKVLTVHETRGISHYDTTEGVDSGVKKVLDLTLRNGMRVKLTPDHRVLTQRGWVRADRLNADTDYVLRPRQITYRPSNYSLRDEEVKLLAYMVTDGSSSDTRARYCDGRKETAQEFLESLRALGFDATTDDPYAKGNTWEVHVKRLTTSGFRDWLKQMNIFKMGCFDAEVPDAVCRAPLNQVALFLNRVWAAEGTIAYRDTSLPRFQLAMASERFIQQVQLLLLRWGIQSRMRVYTSKRKETITTSYCLQVSGKRNIEAFVDRIGVVFSKEQEVQRIIDRVSGTVGNTNVDVVPLTWGEANDYLIDNGIQRVASNKWWSLGTQRSQRLSRKKFDAFCEDFGDEQAVVALKGRYPETVAYERIKSIVTLDRPIPVADIGVPGPTRFTANGLSVHNSTRWGKDFFSCTAMTRLLYELNCLRDPAQSMGLGAGESIHVVPISRTTQQARRIVFGGIASKLNLAPWWRGRFKETLDYIEFPEKKITIIGGASGDAAALGLNVYTALVDEGNFMGVVKASEAAKSAGGKTYDRAQMICDALVRRIQGTYRHSGVKGMLFLISSKRATDDFTERRIREHIKQGTTQGVFVRDYATWHVRPEPFKNQQWYRCSVSSAEGRCRILSDDEKAPKDALVFTFPEDFKSEFERDPAGCFTGDTKISLIDGREVAIADLVGEEAFWTYSFTPEGRFVPGRGHSARLVTKNAHLVEVELDNGEKIRCTPDHRFMLRDGTYLPAMALSPGSSLMPLYRKVDKWGYELLQVNTGSGRWIHTHRLVARNAHNRGERIAKGNVVHHRDFNKCNNAPNNLEIMLREDHARYHITHASCTLHTPEGKAKAAQGFRDRFAADPKLRAAANQNLEKARTAYVGTDKHRETASRIGKTFGFGDSSNPNIVAARSRNGTENITKLNLSNNNPSYKQENREAASRRLKDMDKNTRHKATMAGLHSRWNHAGSVEDCDRCDSRTTVRQILNRAEQGLDIKEAAESIGLTTSGLYYILDREEMHSYAQIRDKRLWPTYRSLADQNSDGPIGRDIGKSDDIPMSQKESGLRASHKRWHSSSFTDCVKCQAKLTAKRPNNHKVVAVRLLAETADVYDITVDAIHNFALSAGVVVANSTRDIAGIATDTYAPFVADRKAIERMFDEHRPQVFSQREWDMGMGPLTINWADTITTNARNEKIPICCPSASRHVHIDLSLNMCATGFNLLHQAGVVEVVRQDALGNKCIEEAPVFHIDGILRIIAGSANEIDHSEIRGLIYRLNEGGFNVRSVGLDHWMSVPNMQLLKKQGYKVAEISTVKKIDPFDTARAALYEGRIISPPHEKLADELRSLELDPRRPHDRPKVIVQHGHTKDLADAWAAGVYYIATHSTGGVILAPSHGASVAPATGTDRGAGQGSNYQWKSGEILFTDEEGYETWEDEDGLGGSGNGGGDPHFQAWII